MSQPIGPSRRQSLSEYFEFEMAAELKHQFFDGQVVAMSGGTIQHALIGSNIIAAASGALKGTPCQAFGPDLRLYVKETNNVFYADASIVCGDPVSDPAVPTGEAVSNPTVVFEVLSPSTEKADRTRKFSAYMRLSSLREYVLVDTDQPRVESFLRQEDGTWSFSFTEGVDAVLKLRALGITLSMADIFARAKFDLPAE